MTPDRITSDRSRTIIRQEKQKEYQYQEASSRSTSSTTAASSSTTTRACACAREEAEAENMARAAILRKQYLDTCEYYAKSFHRAIAPGRPREFATRIKGGMSAEVIKAAIDDTMKAPSPSWAYCAAILRNCDAEQVKTLQQWHDRELRYKSKKNPALNYEQREYHKDDFGEDFFIDLGGYAP